MKNRDNIEIGKHIFIEMVLIVAIAMVGSLLFYISIAKGLI